MMAQAVDGTGRQWHTEHRFTSHHCDREGSVRCPKQPGMPLTGCRSPVSGLAAMGLLQHKGRRAGALTLCQGSAKGSLPLPILPLSPGCFLGASLPVPDAQTLQDPHPNLLTSGQRAKDLSQLLTASTLGKDHWDLSFPNTIP